MKRNNLFGYVALFFGIVAFGIALFHSTLGPIDKPLSINQVVTKKAGEIKENIITKLSSEDIKPKEIEKQKYSKDKLLKNAVVALSFLAIVFSVFSFIKKEDQRIFISAVVLSSGAMLFDHKMVAIVILLLFIYLVLLTKPGSSTN